MLHSLHAKGDSLMNQTSYECEYFSAIKWRTIDGVSFCRSFAYKASVTYWYVGT